MKGLVLVFLPFPAFWSFLSLFPFGPSSPLLVSSWSCLHFEDSVTCVTPPGFPAQPGLMTPLNFLSPVLSSRLPSQFGVRVGARRSLSCRVPRRSTRLQRAWMQSAGNMHMTGACAHSSTEAPGRDLCPERRFPHFSPLLIRPKERQET